MKELELVKNDYSPEILEEVIPKTEWTSSKCSDEINALGRTSMIAIALSSGCVLNANESNIPPRNKITKITLVAQNPIQKSLKDYKDIYAPFETYIASIVENKNYNKHEIIKGILSFKSLENNWDGYGSLPLEIESATNAISLIDLLGEASYSTIHDFYPNPNGTISFVWLNSNNEKVCVEVGNDTMSYFVELSSHEVQFYNKKEVNVKESASLAKLITSL